MIQKMKILFTRAYARFLRLFLPALLVCSIVGLSCAPALALAPPGNPNNILEYKSSVHTEGDAAIVQGTIPLDHAQTRQQVINSHIVTYSHVFDKSWFHFDSSMGNPKAGSYLRAEIFPLGYFTNKNSDNLNKTISLSGLPNGTQFSLDAVIGGIGGVDMTFTYPDTYYQVRLTYFDKDGNNIGGYSEAETEMHYDTDRGFMIYSSFVIDAPSGAVSFRIEYKLQSRIDIYDPSFVYEDGVHSLTFRYVVNQLEFDSALNDYNTNRPLDPESPEGGSFFDEFYEAENELIDDALSNLDGFTDIVDSATSNIGHYAAVFKALGLFMEDFLGIPILRILTGVSLSLGLSGFILGLVNSLGKSKEEE